MSLPLLLQLGKVFGVGLSLIFPISSFFSNYKFGDNMFPF